MDMLHDPPLYLGNGMAAITAVLSTLSSGDLVLAEENVYGCTFRIFAQVFEKFGLRDENDRKLADKLIVHGAFRYDEVKLCVAREMHEAPPWGALPARTLCTRDEQRGAHVYAAAHASCAFS